MDKNFGEKLRFCRLAKKIALKDLGAECGLSYSYISQVERGVANPSLSALNRLAKALDTTVWKLLKHDNVEATASAPGELAMTDDAPTNVGPPYTNASGALKKQFLRKCKVIRKEMRRSIILPQSNVRYEMITPDLNSDIQVLIVEADPGTNSGDQPFVHSGEECCFVLNGRVDMDVGDQKYILEKGDSIYFSSEQTHRWCNIGDEKLVLLLAVSPPAY